LYWHWWEVLAPVYRSSLILLACGPQHCHLVIQRRWMSMRRVHRIVIPVTITVLILLMAGRILPGQAQSCTFGDKRIAFMSDRDNTTYETAYLMNADGTCQTRLTDTAVGMFPPTWSPDGKRLLLALPDIARLDIINADGTKRAILAGFPTRIGGFAWSPDG